MQFFRTKYALKQGTCLDTFQAYRLFKLKKKNKSAATNLLI